MIIFDKWKKVEEVPPIVDEIDSIQDTNNIQQIPQIGGMVRIFIDFSKLGLNEIKAEIVQRSQLISQFLKQMVVKYLAIDTNDLDISSNNGIVKDNDKFDNIKNNTIFEINTQQNYITISILFRQQNKIYHLSAYKETYIHELIKEFRQLLGITQDNDRFYLKYQNRHCESKSRLSDLNIKDGESLDLEIVYYGGCFPGFAPIRLSNQTTKLISEINLGDKILCYDFQYSQFKQSSVVKKFISSTKQQLIEIIFENGRIICTPNHPVYTQTGWKAFQPTLQFQNEPLSINDLVFDSKCNFVKITQINYLKEKEIVYNITTEYPNNYMAFDFLVHNMNKIIIIINDKKEEFEVLPYFLVQNIKKMIELKTGIYWQDQILIQNDIQPIKLKTRNSPQQQIMESQNQTREISIISKNQQHQLSIKRDTNLEEVEKLLQIFEKKENLSTQLILYNGKPKSVFNQKNEEIESVYLIDNSQGGTQLKFFFEINNHQLQNLSQLKDSLQWLDNHSDINEFIQANLEQINSCKQQQTFYQEVNIHYLIAVRLYTSNLIYRRLNCNLRLSQYNGWEKFLKCLLDGLRQMNYFRGLVFRGLKNYRDSTIYQKGKIIQWSEITSISQSQIVAEKFSNYSGMIFYIEVISAKDISNFSLFPTEQELLMYPFSTFKIEDIQDQQNQPTKVIMRELPQPRSNFILLWVDDNPDNNYQLAKEIEKEIFNISIIFCTSTIDAINIIQKYKWLIFLSKSQFRVISDMIRVEQGKINFYAGIELMIYLYGTLKYKNQSMIFCNFVKKAQDECKKQNIKGNFIITNTRAELIKFLKFQ